MEELPEYIDCKTNTEVCEWYMHKLCRETCPYSYAIYGIGATDTETMKRLEDIDDEDVRRLL